MASHQQPSRPAKLAHFEQQPPAHAHAHQHLYVNSNGGSALPPPAHDATTPSPTPSSSSSSCGRRSKLLVEPPLLMSPEINSLMGDERPLQLSTNHQQLHHHQQKPHQHAQQQLRALHQTSHSITPTIVGGQRSNAGDDGKPFVYQHQDIATASHTREFHAPHAPPAHVQNHQLHHYQTRLATQVVAQDLTITSRRSNVSASSKDDDSETDSVSSSSSTASSSTTS